MHRPIAITAEVEFSGTTLIAKGTYEPGYPDTYLEPGAGPEVLVDLIDKASGDRVLGPGEGDGNQDELSDTAYNLIVDMIADEIEGVPTDGSVRLLDPDPQQLEEQMGWVDDEWDGS